MKAMILAAGLAKRLRPLSLTVPKILLPVLGVPLLERLVSCLARGGVEALAMNCHHLPEEVERHVVSLAARYPALPPIALYREAELLGTGGGVMNAADFWWNEPLLVWNGDIVADVEPLRLMNTHLENGALATLGTSGRGTDSQLLLDGAGRLCGIDSPRRGERRVVMSGGEPLRPVAFHGISALSPALRDFLRPTGSQDLIDALLDAVAAGGRVDSFDAGGRFWGTTGTPEKLSALENNLADRPQLLALWTP